MTGLTSCVLNGLNTWPLLKPSIHEFGEGYLTRRRKGQDENDQTVVSMFFRDRKTNTTTNLLPRYDSRNIT